MKTLILTLLFSVMVLASEGYKIIEKMSLDDELEYYVKVDNFPQELKLHIGVGKPKVLGWQTLSENIKLLNCFGGDMGTSRLIGYYYTYILDMKNRRVLGYFEYEDDYGAYSKVSKKPQWSITDKNIVVKYYDNESEEYRRFDIKRELK